VESLTRVGLPASIIKKYGVTKKAWRIYRQKHPKTNKRRRSNPSKVKRVARRRRYTRKRRRRKRTIPIVPIIGVAAGAAEPIRRAVAGDFMGALGELRNTVTGFDEYGNFNPQWLMTFWGPTIGGILFHKVANMLGINRIFNNLPSPLNKLRL